ncbi:MAG: hypothetical protein EOP47_16345 [Sphingobacteriaceae bacterium]|nr:MAG: hypothetical protein EOP47_16345 [Sphingobacteriaceae bacterium]
MKKDLHNSDALFDSPQYGWDQLQLMLDKKLPVKNNNYRRSILLRFTVAALFISILLFSSLVLKNPFYKNGQQKNSATVNTNIPGNEEGLQKEQPQQKNTLVIKTTAAPYLTTGILLPVATQLNNTKNNAALFNNVEAISGYDPVTTNVAVEFTQQGNSIKKEEPIQGETLPVITTAGANIASNILQQPPKEFADTANTIAINKKKKNYRKSWDLSAGLAVNAMLSRKQNLRPYPVAELRYHISDKFFLATGMGIASPVTAESRGISKTVYLNDTTNNVRYYNNIKNYYKLNYIDIPLMAGVKVNKHIAVNGGVQASVLLNSKSKASVERYDYQMNMASGLPVNLTTGVVAAREQEYEATPANIDYRFVAGVKYSLNKATIHLNYQYAPKAVLKGNYVSKDKNELISLGVLLKIK